MPAFPVVAHVNCITIEGPDARRFAQAQFSGDVDRLAANHWQWNAWLTAQGRVQALMQLADAGDGRLLAVLRGGDAQATHTGLTRYMLRAKAKLTVQTFAARAGDEVASGTVQRDGESMVFGYGTRSLRLTPVGADAPIDAAANITWRRLDVRAGWPNLPVNGQSEFLPPALGLEHLGAVAFDKGCYPGQELAARLHYRGGHKRQLCHISGAVPLPLGDLQAADGTQVSVLDSVADIGSCDVLAVLDISSSSEISTLASRYIINRKFDS